MKNKKTRKVDEMFGKFFINWNRDIVVVKKSKIKLWQATFLVAFIVGSFFGTYWLVKLKIQPSSKAASILPPGMKDFTWPNATTGNPYGYSYDDNIRMTTGGTGDQQYWIFEPKVVDPAKQLPVTIFVHGVFALNPNLHEAWITHLVRRGNIIIYPRYASTVADINFDKWTGNAIGGLVAAYRDELAVPAKGHAKPDLGKISIVGHSIGGVIGVNIANHWKTDILPGLNPPAGSTISYYPKTIMAVMSGWGIENPRWVDEVIEKDYGGIDFGPKLITVSGDRDSFALAAFRRSIIDGARNVDGINKFSLLFKSDYHSDEGVLFYMNAPNNLIADHFSPNGWTNYTKFGSTNTGFVDWIVNNFGSEGKVAPTLQKVNTLDYKMWNIFDWACSWGINNDANSKKYSSDISMGKWSDNTPVTEVEILGITEAVSPNVTKVADESGAALNPTAAKNITADSQYIQWDYSDASPIITNDVKLSWKDASGAAKQTTITLPFAGKLWGTFSNSSAKFYPNKIKDALGLQGEVTVEISVKDAFFNQKTVQAYKIIFPKPVPTLTGIYQGAWKNVSNQTFAADTKFWWYEYEDGAPGLNAASAKFEYKLSNETTYRTLTVTPPVNGNLIGSVIFPVATLSNGTYNLRVTVSDNAGTPAVPITANVIVNRPAVVNGNLAINSTPTGANIYINGWNSATPTNHTWTDLKPEPYNIKLTKACYNGYSASVTVPTGGTGTLNATLTATPPSCPDPSTVNCGQTITPTNGCGTCSGTGTKQTCPTGQVCSNGKCSTSCTPNCAGKTCGSNGCGGTCGTCVTGKTCNNGTCVSACTNKCTFSGKQCTADYKGTQTCSDTNGDGCKELTVATCPGSSGCWPSAYGGTNECYCSGKTADGYDAYAKVGSSVSGYYLKDKTSGSITCNSAGQWQSAPSVYYYKYKPCTYNKRYDSTAYAATNGTSAKGYTGYACVTGHATYTCTNGSWIYGSTNASIIYCYGE